METEFNSDHFNMYEKHLLWSIYHYIHVTEEFLVSTAPFDERNKYKKALKNLIRYGYVEAGKKGWVRINPRMEYEIHGFILAQRNKNNWDFI